MQAETRATLVVAGLVIVSAMFLLGLSPLTLAVLAAAAFVYFRFFKGTIHLPPLGVNVLNEEKKAEAVVRDEVFHVGDNKFVYGEADAVCRAYGAQLASYDQIEDSYAKGSEWCSYGWTQGGFALFPTQETTWQKKYKDDPKHSCGRPGINGGYFDPKMKFGVNCYGKKPAATQAELDAMFDAKRHGTPEDRQQKALIDRLKGEIQHLNVVPWNASSWSEFNHM